jgi:hypothetical protein
MENNLELEFVLKNKNSGQCMTSTNVFDFSDILEPYKCFGTLKLLQSLTNIFEP